MIQRLILSLTIVVAAFLAVPSQALAADSILGRWVTEDRDAVVEIKQCGGAVCGRIARFLIMPPDGADQRDINNPDTNLRRRKLLGLAILSQLREDGDLWRGQIYDPNRGRTFRSVIRRTGANTLEVKGCVSFICQTQTWRRAR
ncbi:MAG: DUF2147 domain-containing protein [Erythrobacter sp.]|uniref:DUF2147 domain-containing protein n=1 Tax=Erythrobacter sp. TaxID=1042 RepID=UPI003264B4CA